MENINADAFVGFVERSKNNSFIPEAMSSSLERICEFGIEYY